METQTTKPLRPTFLTVLCILSFVGLGWGLLNDLVTVIFGSVISPFYSVVQGQLEMALTEAKLADPASAFILEEIFEGVIKLLDVLPVFGAVSFLC